MINYYVKTAWRKLVNNKGNSFFNIAGLSLGIFGSIVIFQFVKYHLSTDTYHQNFKNIYRVVMDLHLDEGLEHEKGSPFILHETLKNDFSTVDNTAYIGQQEMTINISAGNSLPGKYLEKESAAFINREYFKIFDYQWLAGSSSLLNMPNTAVLTEKYAKKYFGDGNPINRIININNKQDVKVVGLLKDIPGNTDLRTEVFISLPTMKTIMPDFGYDDWQWFIKSKETYISLKNNTSKEIFDSQFPAFSKKYYAEDAKYYQFHLQKLSDVHFNLDYNGKIKKSTIVFFSLIGLLLIVIASINFINLSTAQSFKRFKEIGIRKTLGSSQPQLFWQFIMEMGIVSIVSVILALFFALMVTPVVNQWLDVRVTFNQFFDYKTLAFVFVLILFITIAAGFYPSMIVAHFNPLNALKGISKSIGEGVSGRKGLVIFQFSISFILVALSVLIVQQVSFLKNKDIGSSKKLILHIKIPNTENNSLTVLKNQLLQKPYVENISFSSNAPSSKAGWGGSIKFDNRDWEKFAARSRSADENYIDTYQIKLLKGRKPVPSDTIREVLINEKLVKELGLKDPEEALNKKLIIGDADNKSSTITGVVFDFNNTDLYSGIEPTVIFSLKIRYKQAAIRLHTFDSKKTIREISKIWGAVYPNDVFEYSFYDEELARFYSREVLTRGLIIFFASLSVFISCLGLFGLVSIAVNQRTKEIGVRKVLGASVSSIISLLSKSFLKLIIIAIGIAIPVAYYFMNKWLQDFAYRTNISWMVFVITAFIAIGIALLTISFQAIKAAVANPVKSLRTE